MKPALYGSALVPGTSSEPCACPWKIAKKPTICSHGIATFERDHQTQQERRRGNRDFHTGQRGTNQAEKRAAGHHHRERDREQPHRGGAELRTPHADCHHRESMVPARQRMTET
jgi:hypothetical protein